MCYILLYGSYRHRKLPQLRKAGYTSIDNSTKSEGGTVYGRHFSVVWDPLKFILTSQPFVNCKLDFLKSMNVFLLRVTITAMKYNNNGTQMSIQLTYM